MNVGILTGDLVESAKHELILLRDFRLMYFQEASNQVPQAAKKTKKMETY